MKIISIETYIVGDVRNFLFVEVETDTGLRGIGEAGVTWREGAVVGFVEALRPSLIGQDPMRTEHLWQLMFRCGFFPANRIGAAAISAIDIALWDIKAKALQVPLYQLLGGKSRDRVVAYPHVVGSTPLELTADAVGKVREGWKFVRFDVPLSGQVFDARAAIRESERHVAAVREAVGDEIELIMDVHTRLDTVDAVTLCRRLEKYHLFFVEDPVRCENPAALRRLRGQTAVPIAMGEQYATKWEFRDVVENNWIDFCRLDLCLVGGFTEALKISGWCETHYLAVAPHNPLGPVSTAACLHFDMAISNFAVQECAREPGQILSELFPQQATLHDGYLLPSTEPGLGVVFDKNALSAYPPVVGDCPKIRSKDGSFTNW